VSVEEMDGSAERRSHSVVGRESDGVSPSASEAFAAKNRAISKATATRTAAGQQETDGV